MATKCVLRVAGQTRTGPLQSENEDTFWLSPARGLVVLADGIGGNAVASRTVQLARETVGQTREAPSPAGLLLLANRAAWTAAAGDADLKGMGCALLIASWGNGHLNIAHAGDIRAYQVRRAGTTLLTQDHSTAAEMARRGHIPAEAVRQHHLRHRLLQAVGRSDQIEPEIVSASVQPGDRMILCTDGLWSALPDEEIHLLASRGYDPQRIARRLLDAAQDNGGQDDMTVIVLLSEALGDWVEASISKRYDLRACLGRGSFATVYGGLDTKLWREVAVKLLYPDCLGTKTRYRFQREAQVLAQIDHPNVVAVYDACIETDFPYVVMQYVPGETLETYLPQLSIAEVLNVTRQITAGLAAAHRRGIIHRDLKPANVLVAPDGTIKVVDFGIAHVPPCFDDLGRLTTDRRIGNVAYMSPEQHQGEQVDARSDLYSLGVTLYEMLTGDRRTATSASMQGSSPSRPPSAYNPAVPPELDELALKLLDPVRENRFGSADELLSALDALAAEMERPGGVLYQLPSLPSDAHLATLREQICPVMAIAVDEAAALQDDYVGTEHLFLALLREPDQATATLLDRQGKSPEAVAAAIRDYVGPGDGPRLGDFPLTPRAQRVLALAGEIAQRAHEHLAAAHLLKAILQEGEGVAARILRLQGIEPAQAIPLAQDEGAELPPERPEEGERARAEPPLPDESLLAQYGRDLTALAREGQLGPVIGREAELRQIIYTLMRREKNNPVLTGEAGVGKTATVEGLAWRIAQGKVPDALRGRRIVELNMGILVAGTKYRGEFEDRLTRLVVEVKDSDVILFIDEIHTIVGAGEVEGGALDAANILKPALARGELRCIGATTRDEYERYIERDAALERRFRPIDIPEPTQEEAITILRQLRQRYERHHGVPIEDAALVAAVRLSARHLPDRHLPDKAIDLVDEAGARVRVRLSESPVEDTSPEYRVTPQVIQAVLADWVGMPLEMLGLGDEEAI